MPTSVLVASVAAAVFDAVKHCRGYDTSVNELKRLHEYADIEDKFLNDEDISSAGCYGPDTATKVADAIKERNWDVLVAHLKSLPSGGYAEIRSIVTANYGGGNDSTNTKSNNSKTPGMPDPEGGVSLDKGIDMIAAAAADAEEDSNSAAKSTSSRMLRSHKKTPLHFGGAARFVSTDAAKTPLLSSTMGRYKSTPCLLFTDKEGVDAWKYPDGRETCKPQIGSNYQCRSLPRSGTYEPGGGEQYL